jgi:hypothetical protein
VFGFNNDDVSLQDSISSFMFRSDVMLTDGGVYDNLGLETAWKRYKTVLVSDGGGSGWESTEAWRVPVFE